MLRIELLVIGNEVLSGQVLDTNSHWLCQQIAAQGGAVTRISVLPDEPAAIAEGLHAALHRRPAAIISCGGLGPTVDDLTVAAIGAALGRRVSADPRAYALVQAVYAALYARGDVTTAEMTPARAKMAALPEGAEPLPNAVGAAPGVLLREGDTLVAALPGVPAEMKAIFIQELWPRLAARFAQAAGQKYAERTIGTDCWDESLLAPTVDAVAARHPQVYVKSRAQVYGSGVADFVTLAARAADEETLSALLDAAEGDLRESLAGVGIKTSRP